MAKKLTVAHTRDDRYACVVNSLIATNIIIAMKNAAIARGRLRSEERIDMNGCENKNADIPAISTAKSAMILNPPNVKDWDISSVIAELLYRVWMIM
jgi:hypothetical protein